MIACSYCGELVPAQRTVETRSGGWLHREGLPSVRRS